MIAVIGAGAWGSALAHAFAAAGQEVALCPLRERNVGCGGGDGDAAGGGANPVSAGNLSGRLGFSPASGGVSADCAENSDSVANPDTDASLSGRPLNSPASGGVSADCAANSDNVAKSDSVGNLSGRPGFSPASGGDSAANPDSDGKLAADGGAASADATATKSIKYINIKEAKAASHLVFALSSAATADYLAAHFPPASDYRAAPAAPATAPARSQSPKVLIATKGLHQGAFMSEVFAPYFEQIAILSGPSFAAEVVRSLPTAIVIASARQALAAEFAALFPAFVKPYTSTDVIGTQIAGAYKNIIAIASGICDALALGNNARAALLSRGLVEMARFGEHFGAQQATFLGLCGAGDLFLTASSTLSRNYRAGALLAAGKGAEAIAAELGEVAEGIITAQQIARLAESACIHAPIAAQTAAIIAGKDIQSALGDLLKR